MTNQAKELSKKDGKKYLKNAFKLQQEVLKTQLLQSRAAITHEGVKGDVNEGYFLDIIRQYLPERYSVDRGIVVNSAGRTSDQIDVIIFDRHYTPTLLNQQGHRLIPAEAVYAVMEVKPIIDASNLDYAADKAASVRSLDRTNMTFRHSGGVGRGRLFNIITGIIAIDVDWRDGFNSDAFKKKLQSINQSEDNGHKNLDCGLALSGGCFDFFSKEDEKIKKEEERKKKEEEEKRNRDPQSQSEINVKEIFKTIENTQMENLTIRNKEEGALAYFLFRLLRELQWLGTAPAIDWNEYVNMLDHDNEPST
ncbi:conserved hypothetical protein [Dickeya parazeae Ech586]|uniref:DUF6602 domain-containing protein n=1 Tax=Dickeya zeae (strain Ech586) TaxID=590409 RepID=D2BV04_DICZ5|nr:DUF6602 domain-containing protein [Dickeya parazeae]ACZ78072.1 conserved hypothetical protein [Dickeya parazeae Ech586]